MKRLLLDTNIYGEMILDDDYSKIRDRAKQRIVIHGFTIIRKELRDAPKKVKIEGKNLRIRLLRIYDELTSKSYDLVSEMEALGSSYFKVYRRLGGLRSYDDMKNDFAIVACASFHQIDVVVSEDNKTMLGKNALQAYHIVNELYSKRTPSFIGYREFKRRLL